VGCVRTQREMVGRIRRGNSTGSVEGFGGEGGCSSVMGGYLVLGVRGGYKKIPSQAQHGKEEKRGKLTSVPGSARWSISSG